MSSMHREFPPLALRGQVRAALTAGLIGRPTLQATSWLHSNDDGTWQPGLHQHTLTARIRSSDWFALAEILLAHPDTPRDYKRDLAVTAARLWDIEPYAKPGKHLRTLIKEHLPDAVWTDEEVLSTTVSPHLEWAVMAAELAEPAPSGYRWLSQPELLPSEFGGTSRVPVGSLYITEYDLTVLGPETVISLADEVSQLLSDTTGTLLDPDADSGFIPAIENGWPLPSRMLILDKEQVDPLFVGSGTGRWMIASALSALALSDISTVVAVVPGPLHRDPVLDPDGEDGSQSDGVPSHEMSGPYWRAAVTRLDGMYQSLGFHPVPPDQGNSRVHYLLTANMNHIHDFAVTWPPHKVLRPVG